MAGSGDFNDKYSKELPIKVLSNSKDSKFKNIGN